VSEGSVGVARGGKRVSWVELYFDLIFVFAMRQASHTLVAEPTWIGAAVALGLFAPLWWTWIGFVVFYNRSDEDTTRHRLFILAGTLPCAVAAIEVHGAGEGHAFGFALALAASRVVLAVAFASAYRSDQHRLTARRVSAGYVVSALAFGLSAMLPAPWRYIVWGLALVQEAGFLLLGETRRRPRRRDRDEALKSMMAPPRDPALLVDAAHLAERFGLFMIILLGEIVVSVGAAAILVEHHGATYWLGLCSGLILAAALWWIYFSSAAEINESVLRASGGNPTVAYGLYAGGHVAPAFALLVVAAGVSLSLEQHPPVAASWLVTIGLTAYLVGTRAVVPPTPRRLGRALRAVAVAGTVCLALLQPWLTAAGVLALATAWAVTSAAIVSRHHPARLSRVAADPLSLLRDR
jgi:low temperature requirement protein LtrA